jgi:NAD-dependent SIR2 family protein deacetylase
MQTESYPTQPTTPTPTVPAQEPALHLLGGIWIASCPTCGYQLTTARTRERCEQRASHRRCPVCREDPDQATKDARG